MRQHSESSVNTVAAQRRRQLATAAARHGKGGADARWLSPLSVAGAVVVDAADPAPVTR